MTIDLNTYDANKKFIQDWAVTKGANDPSAAIAMVASITFVPAIVCAYWIGEATGWPESVLHSIKVITDFYGYTEIVNKPQSCPI